MPTVIPKEKRRFQRLVNYFSPYPQFSLRLSSSAKRPLSMKRVPAEESVALDKYVVSVFAPLLDEKAPDWLEGEILTFARNVEEQVRSGNEDVALMPGEESEINDVFQEAKARIKEEELRLQQEVAVELEESSIYGLWKTIRAEYFPEREDLDRYQVKWSNRRQTQSLASCNAQRRRVVVARAMELPECLPHLEPLLYHEMCHAYLGAPKRVRGRHIYHGTDFKELEVKHPKIDALNKWVKSGGWEKAVRESEGLETPEQIAVNG